MLSNPETSMFPFAVSKQRTPKVMMPAKKSIITDITIHPPQYFMKNISMRERIRVPKIMAREMGQVCSRSAIDSSKKPIPSCIVWAIV